MEPGVYRYRCLGTRVDTIVWAARGWPELVEPEAIGNEKNNVADAEDLNQLIMWYRMTKSNLKAKRFPG